MSGEAVTPDPDRDRGLYRKFELYRVQEDENGNEYGRYQVTDLFFVLRYTRDPYARPALAAYADACEAEYPALAADLRAALERTAQ